jgi:3-methylcrotonyl-CoA carboxylase alpha subunit
MSRFRIKSRGEWLEFDFASGADGGFTWSDGALAMNGRIVSTDSGEGWVEVEGRIVPFMAVRLKNRVHVWAGGNIWWLELASATSSARAAGPAGDEVEAPMPGTVLKIQVAPKDEVAAGQTLIVMESMKMELALKAPREGRIEAVLCKEGDLVDMGAVLCRLEKR